MKREQEVHNRLESLRMLGDAVTGMKSLSAHHFRTSRNSLAAARGYREGIDTLLASIGLVQIAPPVRTPALVLVAADLGLCDGYTPRLVETAVVEGRDHVGPFFCVGRRALPALRRAGIEVTQSYDAAASVGGLRRLLLTLVDDVLGQYLRGRFSTLVVVSARFEGVGTFAPAVTPLLPVRSSRPFGRRVATPYVESGHLARTAVREYLYSTLFELLLDALASEHGARLIATQAAGQWLDQRIRDLRLRLSSARQEASTQEVLDVASGARLRRRQTAARRS